MMAMETCTGVFQRFSVFTAALYQLRRSSNMLQMLVVFCGGVEAQEATKSAASNTRLLFIIDSCTTKGSNSVPKRPILVPVYGKNGATRRKSAGNAPRNPDSGVKGILYPVLDGDVMLLEQ